MTSGPFISARAGQPLDLLEKSAAGGGWQALEELFAPVVGAELQPSDRVAMFLWGMRHYADGLETIEWIMDITLRQPLRATGKTFEETALMTANRQGINGVGEAVLKAIAKGKELADASKNQNGAG